MDILKLPFDQYQRYKIVQEAVDILRDGNPCLKILDVGGYPGQAIDFFPGDDVTVVDQEEWDHPCYRKADALSLPFTDRSFDMVISVDALEHIQPDKRELFLKELCKVSREYVCIAAPFNNPQVHAAERILFEFIKAKRGYEYRFLYEHLNYGLPKQDEIIAYLKDFFKSVIVLPNGNLSRWLPMIMVEFYLNNDARYHTLKNHIHEYYNTHYYKMDNSEPCYRYLLVAGNKDQMGPLKSRLEALVSTTEDSCNVDFSFVSTLINLGLLEKTNEQIRQKDEQIRQKDEQIRQKDEQIKWFLNSKSWRITAPLRKIEDLLREIF